MKHRSLTVVVAIVILIVLAVVATRLDTPWSQSTSNIIESVNIPTELFPALLAGILVISCAPLIAASIPNLSVCATLSAIALAVGVVVSAVIVILSTIGIIGAADCVLDDATCLDRGEVKEDDSVDYQITETGWTVVILVILCSCTCCIGMAHYSLARDSLTLASYAQATSGSSTGTRRPQPRRRNSRARRRSSSARMQQGTW